MLLYFELIFDTNIIKNPRAFVRQIPEVSIWNFDGGLDTFGPQYLGCHFLIAPSLYFQRSRGNREFAGRP